MLIDSSLEMCDGQAATLTTGAGATKLGSEIDVHSLIADNATIDLSAGEPIYLVIQVATSLTEASGGGIYEMELRTSTATALTGGTTVAIWTTDPLDITDHWTAGKTWIVSLPKSASNEYHRYLGFFSHATGQNCTGGTINAFLTKDVTNWSATNTRTG
jgi:hypothetical protein